MILNSLNMPDDPSDLSRWMEDLLVSPDLMDTVIELELFAGIHPAEDRTLDSVLVGIEDQVLDEGLMSVPGSTIRSLLRNPSLLLKLQEKVLMHGATFGKIKSMLASKTAT